MASGSKKTTKEKILNILLCGGSSNGKSSLLNSYIYNAFIEIKIPTETVDFNRVTHKLLDKEHQVQIWSISHQLSISQMEEYARNADVIIGCYSVVDKDFKATCELLKALKVSYHDPDKLYFLCSMKQDIVIDRKQSLYGDDKALLKFLSEFDIRKVFSVSSKTMTYVNEMFTEVIEEALLKRNRPDIFKYMAAYHKACKEGSQKVHRTRIMLIGHSGVGKTCVMNRLLGLKSKNKYVSTSGINATIQCDIEASDTSKWKPIGMDAAKLAACDLHKIVQDIETEDDGQEIEAKADVNHLKKEEDIKFSKTYSYTLEKRKVSQKEKEDGMSTHPSHVKDAGPNMGINLIQQIHKIESEKSKQGSKYSQNADFYRLSFWDFGGHFDFYATHLTFLTNRAVYLLVLNLEELKDGFDKAPKTGRTRKSGKAVTCIPQKVKDYINFWLSNVATHATKEASTKCPSVIIVGTHKDKLGGMFGTKRDEVIDETISSLKQYLDENKHDSQVVSDYFAIDNQSGDSKTYRELKDAILKVASEQSFWEEERPVKWLELERRILQTDHGKPFILDLEDIVEKANGLQMDNNEILSFLHYQHLNKDFTYFDKPGLSSKVVVQPQGLIDVYKSIITPPELRRKEQKAKYKAMIQELDEQGILDVRLVEYLWEEHSKQNREFLLLLMQQLDLLMPAPDKYKCIPSDQHDQGMNDDHDNSTNQCQSINDTELETKRQMSGDSNESTGTNYSAAEISQYIVPCLMPITKNRDSFTKNPKLAASLFYVFEEHFLPLGLFHRLEAKLSKTSGWEPVGSISYDFVTFQTGHKLSQLISVDTQNQWITVNCYTLSSDAQADSEPVGLEHIQSIISTHIDTIICTYHPSLKYNICFVPCQEESVPDAKCFIPVGSLEDVNKKGLSYLVCPEHHKPLSPEDCMPWFKSSSIKKSTHVQPKELHDVSRYITTSTKLLNIGLGLNVPLEVIESCKTNHAGNINVAGYYVLKYWFDTEGFKDESKDVLKKVLQESGIRYKGAGCVLQ